MCSWAMRTRAGRSECRLFLLKGKERNNGSDKKEWHTVVSVSFFVRD